MAALFNFQSIKVFSLNHSTVHVFTFWSSIEFFLGNIFFKLALVFHFEGWAFLIQESQGSSCMGHRTKSLTVKLQRLEAPRASFPTGRPWQVTASLPGTERLRKLQKPQLKRDRKLPSPSLWPFYLIMQVFITPFTCTWGLRHPAWFFKPVVKVFAHKVAAAYCKSD